MPEEIKAKSVQTFQVLEYRCPKLGAIVQTKILSGGTDNNCRVEGAHGCGYLTTEKCVCGELHELNFNPNND